MSQILLSPGKRRLLQIGAGLAVGYAGLVVAAAWPSAWWFLAFLLVCAALDLQLELRERSVVQLLGSAQFGPSQRALLQALGLAVLAGRTWSDDGRAETLSAVALCAALPLARALYMATVAVWRRRSYRPVLARNVDLGPYDRPLAPPEFLLTIPSRRLPVLGAVPLLLGGLGAALDALWLLMVATVVYVVLVLAGAALIGVRALGTRRLAEREGSPELMARLARLDPEVVLYSSGSAETTYQVDMWLETLARTDRRCVVLLRERAVFDLLAPTQVPVLCVPSAVTVMHLPFDSARVALYTANTGKNIHFLREPSIKHVFIGHGDSDKVSSFNPFSRVYDEIWVAGPAGRERYARAQIGVRDEDIVEVGRPQLDAITRTPRPRAAGEAATVLYAPTWEGWNDEDFASSITTMGPKLVQDLLDAGGARVIYKPHPLTGIRDPKAKLAHERIVAMVTAAGGDHEIVVGKEPTLYQCFDACDLMIADVSSVVSDFLASGKPYACANPRAYAHADFHAEFPTTSAGYVVDLDGTGLEDVLAVLRDGVDPLAAERERLRHYLLGPDEPASIVRWNAAIDALATAPRRAVTRAARGGVDEEQLFDEAQTFAVPDGREDGGDLGDADAGTDGMSNAPSR